MHIPDKIFFRIGEVAKLAGVEPYVLRYWETEFKSLRPKKNENGQRLYQKKEVQLAIEIKKLLHEMGYTIEGAKKVLKKRGRRKTRGHSQLSIPFDRDEVIDAVEELKKELRELLRKLT